MMNAATKVSDILRTKDTRIITVRLRETVATAAMLMQRENISALVVKDVSRTEGNIVVGVFTERDLARAVAAHGAGALDMQIANLIQRPLAQCSERDTLDTVLRLMDQHQIRLLPVMEEHTLIGVISISDIIRNAVLQADGIVRDPTAPSLHA
jgi:CBS domain-containing protein